MLILILGLDLSEFVHKILSCNFLPCINHPTRISHCSSTIIDNIFTNSTDSDIASGNILSQISDHFPQFLILKSAEMHHKTMPSFKWDYSSFNVNSFIGDSNKMDITYNRCHKSLGHFQKIMKIYNLLSISNIMPCTHPPSP